MVRCEPQAAHGYAALACGYLPSTATPLFRKPASPRKPPTKAKIATPATPRANHLTISRANPDASLLTHVKTHTFTNLLTIGLIFTLTLHRENYFT